MKLNVILFSILPQLRYWFSIFRGLLISLLQFERQTRETCTSCLVTCYSSYLKSLTFKLPTPITLLGGKSLQKAMKTSQFHTNVTKHLTSAVQTLTIFICDSRFCMLISELALACPFSIKVKEFTQNSKVLSTPTPIFSSTGSSSYQITRGPLLNVCFIYFNLLVQLT